MRIASIVQTLENFDEVDAFVYKKLDTCGGVG